MAHQIPPSAMSSAPPAPSSAPINRSSPQGAAAKSAKQAAPGSAPGKPKMPIKKAVNLAAIPFWLGILASIMWVGIVVLVVAESGPAHTFGGLPLVNWAIGISAIVSPVAFIWMVTAYLQRAADIQIVAEPLRRQLSIITGESGIAETRIRRFNQAIREQVDLLKDIQSSSHGDFAAIIDRVQKSRLELEQFEQSSIEQVRDIQEIIRSNMQQIDQLMDEKFTMMRVLDDKLVQSGEGVARQTEGVREQISKLLDDVEDRNRQLIEALGRAQQDSKKLADTTHLQESSLVAAAENAADILGGVSNKIDLSVARFLERAGTAREEAERLAGALDTQTRAMEEFSTTLPARVTETEVILRGVADRLYSSEKSAREQATHLTDKLAQQVNNLQDFMSRFAARFTEIDGSVGQRCSDLDKMAARIIDTTVNFSTAWEKSVNDLSDRSNDALTRFTVINDETRKNADAITWQLNETTSKYEDVATRSRTLSEGGQANLDRLAQQIEAQLKHFESLHETSRKMGDDVEARAGAAMQNLQFVLERLLAAREATQTVGETLVKDLYRAVDQNEALIGRLNEAATVGVKTLSAAADIFGQKEGQIAERTSGAEKILQEAVKDLSEKAQAAVSGLQQQTSSLTTLLAQAQVELDKSDNKIQSFVARALPPVQDIIRHVDTATQEGVRSIAQYGDGMQQQLVRLQGFNNSIGGMGQDIVRVTSDTVATLEQLQNRFNLARAEQEDAAQRTLMQFADLADRLNREAGGLEGQASEAVASLQAAAVKVGEQSYAMLQTAENSGAKIHGVATALQNEAVQIRTALQKQAEDLNADIIRTEKQFSTLGEAIQQRTDAAYALLDRVATHYNETTSTVANDLESRTEHLEGVTTQVQAKLENVSATLGQQLSQLTVGSEQLENQATQIAGASGKALQQLSAVNEKLTLTHETANRNAQQTIMRLEETGVIFLRQSNSLAEAAQNSTNLIQKAGVTFGEQSGKMLDQTHQAEQQLRQLSALTASMGDQSAQIRATLEQQTQRLVTQLTEALRQMENSSERIQQTSTVAIATADQVSARFNAMTDSASAKLTSSSQSMEGIANKAESTLGSIGASITQQAASLSVLSEQLVEQQRILSSANENQRQQLVDLFEKLGQAHGQASQVAESTIAKLEDSLIQIQRQLGAISDQSQTAVGNVRAAGDGFTEQAGLLLQNAQQAEQQARTVLSVTAALQDQARQLREALHGEGDRTSDVLGSLISKLTASGLELRDFSSSTEMSLTSLMGSVGQHSQALSGTMQQIGERQRTLTASLDAQRDVLNGLLSRLTVAQDETASVAERTTARLTDGTTQITQQIETLEARARSAIANVQAANNNFAENADALGSHAREAEQHVRTMIASTTTLQEQTRQMRETLLGEGERANDVFATLLNRLTEGGTQLRELVSSTESSIANLQSGFSQQTGTMNTTMLQLLERQKTMTGALSEQREVMDALLTRLSSAQDETALVAERTVERLANSTQTMSQQIVTLDAQAQSALASVEAAGRGFANEADTLSTRAQDAEQQVRSIQSTTAAMSEETQQVRTALQGEATRTNDLLANLLGRLAQGGSQLRELASSAETSISGLHGGLVQQNGEIGTIIAEAVERQKSLTAVFADQREVMDALLTRLTSAQDETALVAERTTERLTDSAQSMTQQIETLENQAKAVIASVEAASSGFANEADALSARARDTEQQVRSLHTSTATMSEETRQLRNALREEADQQTKAVEASTAAIAEQSQRIRETLQQETEQQIKSVQSSASAIAEQSQKIRETLKTETEQANTMLNTLLGRLEQGGSQLRDFASTTEEAITSLQRGITLQGGAMNGTMQQIVERQESLTSALSEQRNVLDSLLKRLSVAQDETATAAEQTVTRLSESSTSMLQHLQGFDTQVKSVMDNVEAANSNFVQESNVLNAHAREAEQQVRSVMAVTTSLQEQTKQMREALQTEGERASDVLANLLVRLEQSGDQVHKLTTTAEEAISRLQDGFSEQSDAMGSTMQQILERQKVLSGALIEQRSVVDTLLNHLAQAQDDTAKSAERTVERLSDSTLSVTRQIETLDTHAKNVIANVTAANASFAQEVDSLGARARAAEEQAKSIQSSTFAMADQTRQLRDTLQEEAEKQTLSAQTSALNIAEQARQLRETLQNEAERTNEALNVVLSRLAKGGQQLRDIAGTTEESIANLHKGLAEQGSAVGDTMQQILERQQVLSVALSKQRGDLDILLGRLTSAQDETAATAERTASRLANSALQMVQQLVSMEAQAKNTLADIETTGKGFNSEAETFKNYAQSAEQQARSVQDSVLSMAQQTRQLQGVLQNDAEKTNETLSALLTRLTLGGQQLRDFASLTEESIVGLQKGFAEQGDAMGGSMQTILERQQVLTKALSEQRTVLDTLLARLATAQDETATAADRTVGRITDSADRMVQQLATIETQAKNTLVGIETTSKGFNAEAETFKNHAQFAEQQARLVQDSVVNMAQQTRQLQGVLQNEADRTNETLNALLGRLTQGGHQLREFATSTEEAITSLQTGFAEQGGAMGDTMQQILERQQVLTKALTEQRDVLGILLGRFAAAQDETAAAADRTVGRITSSAEKMVQQLATIELQAKNTLVGIETSSKGFNAEAETFKNHAQFAEEQARSVQESVVNMAQQTRQLQGVLQNEADRTNETLNALLGRLTQGGHQLREFAVSTEEAITSLQKGFAEQGTAMGGSMQQILERQQVLTKALSEQRTVLDTLLARLATAQDETATTADRTLERLTYSARQMGEQLATIETQAKNTLEGIETTSRSFNAEAETFTSYAAKAEQQVRTLHSEGQRAGETLTHMLEKLAQGSGQIQLVASTSQSSLTNLGHNLSEQTTEISGVMTHIIERQRQLTAALAEQREMMGSLLTHVTQAQDQTAATTERTVIRLSEGAQEIVKQLENIGSTAQTTLANVQTAGRGFAEEAGTLGLEAQKAEQNMRTALAVMGGLHGQAQTLREALHAETERVIGEIRGVVVQLDKTSQHLKTQGLEAVQSVDQSAQMLATLAKTSAESVLKQADILNQSAEVTEVRVAAAGEKIKSHIQGVTDIGAQTEVQARQLADIAEYAHNRLDALRNTIVNTDRDGQSTLQQATERIDGVKQALESGIDRLAGLARTATNDVFTASQHLITQSDLLRANLANSETALSEAASLMKDEGVQVPATLHRSAATIEAIVKTLRQQASEADNTLVGTADRFIEVTTSARENLGEEMQRIQSVAENAGILLRQFTSVLSSEVTTLQANTETLSRERRDLVEKSEQSVAQLAATSDHMKRLCADTTVAAEKLAKEFVSIDEHASTTSQRLEQATVTTAKTMEAMAGIVSRAETQVASVSNGFRDQLDKIRVGLQGQIDDINNGLVQITTQLERSSNTLRSTTAGSVADVERVSQRFNETTREASTQLDSRTSQMRFATEEVAKLLSGFGDQLDVLLDRLSMAGDGIKRQEGSLVNQMQSALQYLSTVAERLESGRALVANVSDQTVGRLNEVVSTIQGQMQTMASGSQTAAGIMRGIGQIYDDQTHKLHANVTGAHDQVKAMNQSIDEMQQRADRIRGSLKLQSEELMVALQQILSQLSATGEALGNGVDQVLFERAEDSLKKIS